MQKRNVFLAKTVAILSVVPVLLYAFQTGPDPGKSAVTGESLCTEAGCHVGTANSGPGSVAVALPNGLSYTPGVQQHLVVTVADPVKRRWGFQLTARQSGNPKAQAGTFTPGPDGFTQVNCANTSFTVQGPPCNASLPLLYIEHTQAGTRLGQLQSASFEFDWTPPATDVGNIDIFVAGNAANGDSQPTGDSIYTNKYTLSPAASGGSKPTITSVVNGASFQPGIAAGSWVTISGANLATNTRTWRNDEIVNGKLPLELDTVSVTINGKPAAVFFISPTQLNVQAPSDDSLGPVNVRVTYNGVSSDPATAQLQAFSPAFFLWPGSHAVATRPDFSFVGPPGLFPGVTTVPAKPGDVIILWGTGFGPTNPAVPAGQLVPADQAPVLVTNPAIRVGGVTAEFLGAALSPGFAGLYQIAIRIPDSIPDGEIPVVADFGSVQSPNDVLITVQK